MTLKLGLPLRHAVMLLFTVGWVVASEFSQVPGGHGMSDAEIVRRFEARRLEVLSSGVAAITEGDPSRGSLLDVAVALQRGERREAALARLAVLNQSTPTGNMFWVYPMAAVMAAGGPSLDQGSQRRIAELWRTYWPSRGDTENHWVMYYGGLYVAAQARAGTGPEQWFNGQSAAENREEARAYLEHWMRVTTSFGQGEYDSPGYIGEYVVPLALLAGWCEDPVLRQKARMMLDYIIYDYVIEHLSGQYAGAHSRVYPRQALQPARTTAAALGWLLFGLGDRQISQQALLLAMSGYTPPPLLERIARTPDRPYVERELKRTRWRVRQAGPESFVVGDKRTAPVYKVSYVDRDFVLGSSQGGLLQPIQQQTWSLRWRVEHPLDAFNSFFALHPYSSPHEGTMYFPMSWDTATDTIVRSKVDYDSPDKLAGGSPHEQVFQQGAALIALYEIPPGTRHPHVTALFSRDVREVVEDPSGWIFAQGGPVYFAYRPLVKGEWRPNDWTGLLAGGAGAWISAGFKEWGTGHRCYVSAAPRNGYVVQVAPARDFATYDAFQAAIRSLPLSIATEPGLEVRFTTLEGSRLVARYGQAPSVNGGVIDYASWPLFESPFGLATRGSQRLEIRYGVERYVLDFERAVIERSLARP